MSKKILICGSGEKPLTSAISEQLGEDIEIVTPDQYFADEDYYAKEAEKFIEHFSRIDPIDNDLFLSEKPKPKDFHVSLRLKEYISENNTSLEIELKKVLNKTSDMSRSCREYLLKLYKNEIS